MKKNLLLLTLFLCGVTAIAQIYAGDTWVPILDGQFYAIKEKTTGKCGVFNKDVSAYEPLIDQWIDQMDLAIVPPIYDDIALVSIVLQEGQMSSDIAFGAMKDNKYELYDMDGFRLTDGQSGKYGWLAKALGTCFCSAAVARADGKGYDMLIIMEWPTLNTLVTGPFDLFYYTKVDIGDKEYFYIKARRSGTENLIDLDPFGKPLSSENIAHLDKYYEQQASILSKNFLSWPKGKKVPENIQREMFQAASYGHQTLINALAKTCYEKKAYERLLKWAWGPASSAKCGKALFYAAECYRMGLGTEVAINHAKYLYEKSKMYGCADANAGLMAIEKIEQPITVKAGDSSRDFDMMKKEELEALAKGGDIEAIKTYCHQATFHSFGCAFFDGENAFSSFGDGTAVELLPLLLGAAPQDANCQLMLACIYAGPEAVGCERKYTYSFRNIEKAKYWIEKFASNPKRNDARGWGYEKSKIDEIIKLIRNMKE